MFFTSFWIFVVNVALLLLFRFSKTTSTNHDGELLTTTVNDMLRLAAAAKLLLKLSLILFLLLSSFSSREIVGGRRKKKMVYRSLSFSYVLPLVASRCSSPYSVVVPTIFQPFFLAWIQKAYLIAYLSSQCYCFEYKECWYFASTAIYRSSVIEMYYVIHCLCILHLEHHTVFTHSQSGICIRSHQINEGAMSILFQATQLLRLGAFFDESSDAMLCCSILKAANGLSPAVKHSVMLKT